MAARVIFGSAGLDADLTSILGLENEAAPAKVAPSSKRPFPILSVRSALPSLQQVAPKPRRAASAHDPQEETAPPLQAPPVLPQQRWFTRFSRRALPPSSPLDVLPARSRQQTKPAPVSKRAATTLTEQASPAPTQKPDAPSPQRQPVRARLLRGPIATIASSMVLILAVGTAVMMHQAPVELGSQSKGLPTRSEPGPHSVGPGASVPAVEQVASADRIRADQTAGEKDANRGGAPVPAVANTVAVESSPVPAINAPAPARSAPARSAPARLAQAGSERRAQGSSQSRFVASSSLASTEVATAYAAIPATQPPRSITVETAGAVAPVSAAPSGRAELARSSQPARVEAPSTNGEAMVPASRVRRDGLDAIRALRRQ